MKSRRVWIIMMTILVGLITAAVLTTRGMDEDLWGPWLNGQDSRGSRGGVASQPATDVHMSKIEDAMAFYARGGADRGPDARDEIHLELRIGVTTFVRFIGVDDDGVAEPWPVGGDDLWTAVYEPTDAEGVRTTHRFGPYPARTSNGAEVSKVLIVCSTEPLSEAEFTSALEGIASGTRATGVPEIDVFFVLPRPARGR